jgi:hypothetical protein
MDLVLHAERLAGGRKRLHRCALNDLPDGAMITSSGADALAVNGDALLPWTPFGYGAPQLRPTAGDVHVLTPPSILHALAQGYRPQWHDTGGAGELTESPRGRPCHPD